jgi:hypothetical protein
MYNIESETAACPSDRAPDVLSLINATDERNRETLFSIFSPSHHSILALALSSVINRLPEKELSTERDLVHRDISYNNVLLLESEDGDPNDLRSGLLIDLEYAASRSLSRAFAPGSRTVRDLFPRYFQFSSICITGNCAIYGS